MNCPNCSQLGSKVVDKRNNNENGTVRRRRECLSCGHRYTTYERIESARLLVRKKSGRIEEYERNKLRNSVLKGMKKRSVSEEEIELLINSVELELINKNKSVIDSREIGLAVLGKLKNLDPVAYMLYATVYLDFDSLEDIEAEIQNLKTNILTA